MHVADVAMPSAVALAIRLVLVEAGEVLSSWQRFAYGRVMAMTSMSNPYRGFRFPAEIINQAIWLYHCFSLSLREVELILAARHRG
jgi:hypothetical protein